jgi:hypothetical protein
MEKLSYEINGEWVDHSHTSVYERQENRISIAWPSGEVELFLTLLNLLQEPLHILYVLHTSRGEAEVGRYQSPALNKVEVSELISEYALFLSKDSRFDLWFYSPAQKFTLVWDRHNLVYVYGPLDEAEEVISKNGFVAGHPRINFDHQHHYRQEFDADSKSLLDKYDWVYSPLKESDIDGVY